MSHERLTQLGVYGIVIAVLLAGTGAAAIGGVAAQESEVNVTIEGVPDSVEAGDTVEFEVVFDGGDTSFADLEFLLTYEEDLVEIEAVEAVDFSGEEWLEVGPTAENGEVDYGAALTGDADDAPTSGTAVAVEAVVSEDVVDGDGIELAFESATTNDPDGEQLDTVAEDATFVVDQDDSEPDPSPDATAVVSAEETTVEELETVVLEANESAGEGDLTFDWDFGDGETANDTDQVVEHSYAEAGNYTVTLTVTDEVDGETETDTDTIEIEVTEETEDEVPGFGVVAAVLAVLAVALTARTSSRNG